MFQYDVITVSPGRGLSDSWGADGEALQQYGADGLRWWRVQRHPLLIEIMTAWAAEGWEVVDTEITRFGAVLITFRRQMR
jgi:hypothetical protein